MTKECDFRQLRADMAKAAAESFAALRKRKPKERFYAFALYTDDDCCGAIPAGNSEEALRNNVKRYARGGTTLPDSFLRWSVDEWSYPGGEKGGSWAKIWKVSDRLSKLTPFPKYRRQVLGAMIGALGDADAVGAFGTGEEREAIMLMIWITDSEETEDWCLRSVKKLNSRKSAARFKKEFEAALQSGGNSQLDAEFLDQTDDVAEEPSPQTSPPPKRTWPDDDKLLAAVIARAADDAPRLRYADWLEKHGDPVRAEFIRAQCAVAGKSPADADYFDWTDRHEVAAARLYGRSLESDIPQMSGFRYGSNLGKSNYCHFRRGFPYVFGVWLYKSCPAKEIPDRLVEVLKSTTLRELELAELPLSPMREVLTGPAAEQLEGLIAMQNQAECLRFAQIADGWPKLKRLILMDDLLERDAPELARVAIDRLDHLQFHPNASAKKLVPIMETDWFKHLRSLSIRLTHKNVTEAIEQLAKMPELHTLRVWGGVLDSAPKALAEAGEFPSLAKLCISDIEEGDRWMAYLAKSRFPQLRSLTLQAKLSWTEFKTLLSADWFAGLREWETLSSVGGHGAKGADVLAKSPCAAHLRNITLEDSDCRPDSLETIGQSGTFPAVTSLDIGSDYHEKRSADALVRFLEKCRFPRLRSLKLGGWPLGDAGARALAKNRSFANLTHLKLANCTLGPRGMTELLRSSNMRRLASFELYSDDAAAVAEALCDPDVLPEIGYCSMHGQLPIPDAISDRLRKARGIFA
jgi:uncharacterized protein (TIGR02996 family)